MTHEDKTPIPRSSHYLPALFVSLGTGFLMVLHHPFLCVYLCVGRSLAHSCIFLITFYISDRWGFFKVKIKRKVSGVVCL